ncbi:MAG: aminotransferase class I/II-fold pyridoxal phosphate-dependent enzyme, partial [Gemmatimonadetes bacterium]|nr:aminotransferase class I/II-fold pyridoxal phosphate-dependent enzyme [Gemmatimonadota bacterium]
MSEKCETHAPCSGTRAVHAGEERGHWGKSLTVPIAQTSTYVFEDTQAVKAFVAGKNPQIDYGRYGNPTQHAAESKLAELEGAEAAILFSSGMSAVTTTLLGMLSTGHHAVIMDDCYRKTAQFCQMVLRKFGIETTFVHAGDYAELEGAVRDNTRVIISESPTNPHLNVIDLEKLVDIGRRHRVKTIIDSTFATPLNQRPLALGV